MTWRIMKTLTIALAMKLAVATSERMERREKPTDAMAAGAALAVDGAEANEQAGHDHQRQVRRNRLADLCSGKGHYRKWGGGQSGNETEAGKEGIVAVGRQQAACDAADAGCATLP